jgi:hypothetical protein
MAGRPGVQGGRAPCPHPHTMRHTLRRPLTTRTSRTARSRT